MKDKAITGGKWDITKIILAILSFICFIYMLCAGADMINANSDSGRKITPADYGNLTVGETVNGKLNNIIMEYQGDESADSTIVSYYLVKSDDDRLITFRTESGSECDNEMQMLLRGGADEVLFRGYVKEMKDTNKAMLNIQRIADNTLIENNIDGAWSEVLISQVIDITEYDAQISDKAIICTFVGAGIMLLLTVLFLRKTVKNVIYSIQVAKGIIVPETNTKPEKELETEKFFDGGVNEQGFFYVGYEQEEDKKSDEDINNS